jgi:hypothetical protein
MSERRSRFAPESGASVLHDRCSLGDDFTESHVPGRLQDGVGSGREIVGVQVESRHVDDDALLLVTHDPALACQAWAQSMSAVEQHSITYALSSLKALRAASTKKPACHRLSMNATRRASVYG